MPELKCNVQTCQHNKNFLCDLDKVEVGGKKATTAGETSCDSFQERKVDSYSNSAYDSSTEKKASLCSCVDCKATECMYNSNCECQAGKIDVEGNQASRCEGTNCATFQCR